MWIVKVMPTALGLGTELGLLAVGVEKWCAALLALAGDGSQ